MFGFSDYVESATFPVVALIGRSAIARRQIGSSLSLHCHTRHTTFEMLKTLVVLASLAVAPTLAHAQSSQLADARDSAVVASRPAWVTKHDVVRAGIAAAAIGVISLADESVAKATQRRWLQQNHTLNNTLDVIQFVGDPGTLVVSGSLFVIGKLTHHPLLASASLRAGESIVASGAVTQMLKLSLGRARPVVTNDQNAYVFHGFHGAKENFNSFPSGHTTAVFAAATVFSAEIHYAHPKAARFTTPLLYGLASAVGGARMYNNRHWLSDVVGGALIGHFAGRKIMSRVVR